MIELLPHDYQEVQIMELSQLFAQGKRKLVNQLNTGGGKTVEFSTITFRFNTISNQKVMIMVHRDELMNQTIKTLKEWYNMDAQAIVKGNKNVYDRDVYVGMVETCFNRLNSNPHYFPEIGLVILDEAHEGNFKKIHQFFPNALIIAFTATPIYSDKKYPMNMDYEDIVVGPQVNELIRRKALCQNITYSISEINRNGLRIKGNDFDQEQMSKEFSKHRNIKNTIDLYEELTPNTKAICFNVNIEHSLKMTEAWRSRGYETRHVDGKTEEEERAAIMRWYYDPRPTILNNVGIVTMGYDNPYITNIISNFSTLSLSKILQVWGRGGRRCNEINKEYFSILDMGGNARYHGDWNMDRDWRDLFLNPPKKRDKKDAAPYKDCPKCRALIPIQARECPYCGFAFAVKQVSYDEAEIKLELVTKNLDVKSICETNANKNVYYSLFVIENNLITQAKYKLNAGAKSLSKENAEDLIKTFMPLAEEWANIMDKKWSHHKSFALKHVKEKITATFGYRFDEIENIKPLDSISTIISI